MASNVVGRIEPRDKHSFEILTGRFDFYGDRLNGKKFFGAVKLTPCVKGKMVNIEDPTSFSLASIALTNRGSGYTCSPKVTFEGGGGSGATARAFVLDGVIAAIVLVNRGSGYTSPPRIAFEGGSGYGASATCTLRTTELDIDTTEALAVPGVRAVLTGADDSGLYSSTTSPWLYARPVAAVVADDWDTANYACGLVKVNYEEMAAVSEPDDAIRVGAPIYNNANGNLLAEGGTGNGGAPGSWAVTRPSGQSQTAFDTAYAGCSYTVEHVGGWTANYQHNMLEPHGQTVWWVGDHLYAWYGTQDVHSGRGSYTGIFPSHTVNGVSGTAFQNRLQANNVHCFTHGTGGGHGDKTGAPLASLAIKMSLFVDGAPVTLVQSRPVNMGTNSRQGSFRATSLAGGSIVGGVPTVQAFSCDMFSTAGTSGGTAMGAAPYWDGIQQSYTIPNLRCRNTPIYSNQPARGAWRCVGDPPAAACYDPALDLLAYAMGTTPYLLRRGMARRGGQTATGYNTYTALELPLMLDTLVEMSDYNNKFHLPKARVEADGRYHGIGIACHVDNHGTVNTSGRSMSLLMTVLNNNVHATVFHGGARGCTGAPSAMCCIVADVIGLKYENVVVEFGNTDLTYTAGMQAGSQHTTGAGYAAYNVAMKARDEIYNNALAASTFTSVAAPTDRAAAKAVATIDSATRRVTAVNLVAVSADDNPPGGKGYTGVPRVTFSGGGGSGAAAVAFVSNGLVTHFAVTNPGQNYTSAPTVTVGWMSIGDLESKDNIVSLKTGLGTASGSINTYASNTSISNGYCASNAATVRSGTSRGSAGACAEVLVDTETGEVEVIAMYNCVDTGGTLYKRGAIKEMLSGCELMVAQALFYGDIYDPKSATILSDYYTESMSPTSLDMNTRNFYVQDIESGDVGPYGAHGIAEPCVSNYSAIWCAIYNAIEKFPKPELRAATANIILKALDEA
ncbi:MAG: molybdopterin-dependent oxidoreductase [Dehalococcoidia bacterium]|nr:molybdopterin-dependent oxidoreductase [Dehalococcoidia bacterium]